MGKNIILTILFVAALIATILLPIFFDIKPGTANFNIYAFIGIIISAVLYGISFWYATRDLSKKDIEIKKLESFILSFQPLLKKIEYHPRIHLDKQWEKVIEKLRSSDKLNLFILNFTNTYELPFYAENLALVIEKIIKMYHKKALAVFWYTKPKFVESNNLIDWKNIVDSVKDCGVNYSLSLLKKDLNRPSISELDPIFEEIISNSKTEAKLRDNYLLRETYLLIRENGIKTKRLYHLDWELKSNNKNKEQVYDALYNRFLFACSTITNCLFSSSYSMGILPARLKIPILVNYNVYSIIYGSDYGADDKIWLSSGLNTEDLLDEEDKQKDIETVEYLLLSADGTEDKIIAAKCSIIEKHLTNIWDTIKSNRLVIFENSVIYRLRLDEIKEKISGILTQEGYTDKNNKLNKCYNRFRSEIDEFDKEFPDIISINDTESLSNGIIDKDIWFESEIEKFNEIFQ